MDELSEIQDLAKDFGEKEIRTRWAELDGPNDAVLSEILAMLGGLGFFAMPIGEEEGGSGLGMSSCAGFIEEISKISPALGVILASHVAGLSFVTRSPYADHKREMLRKIAAEGEAGNVPLLTACWMEEDVQLGSGLFRDGIETALVESQGAFVLRGRKLCVPVVPATSYLLVPARSNDTYAAWVCIPRDTQGVTVGVARDFMGLRFCSFCEVVLDNVEVSAEQVLAMDVPIEDMLKTFLHAGACLGAVGLGMAKEAHDKAARYAIERYQGGKMICDHDTILEMLAAIALGIETCGATVSESAARADSATVARRDLLCPVVSADVAVRTGLDAVQILGGYGYMRDYGIERILRDAKTFQNAVVVPEARKREYARQAIEVMQ